MRFSPALTLLSLCAACATATPPPAPPAPAAATDPDRQLREEVEQIRARVRAHLTSEAELYWNSWTTGEPLAASHAKLPVDLFTVDVLKKVEQLRARTSDPVQGRALALLARYVASEVVAAQALSASEALGKAHAGATFTLDGQEHAWRDLDSLLSGEGHTGRRRRLVQAALPAARAVAAARVERDRRFDEAALALGYEGFAAIAAGRRQSDLGPPHALAQDVLARTDEAWRAALLPLAKSELGLAAADVRWADLPRLFRTGQVDASFPKERMEPALRETLAGMGLDPARVAGLKLDAEPRARKSPRALALPVRGPNDVRLSFKPSPGLGPFAQLLHEAGHALRYALVTEPTAEFQVFGDPAVDEAWGQLFDGLVDEPGYAARAGLDSARLAAHVRTSALRRLFALRRAAAEVLVAQGAKPEAAFGQALGMPVEEADLARFAAEARDSSGASDELLARLAAFQLAAALGKEQSPWWSGEKAGAKLREWMAPGGARDLGGVLDRAGAGRLDPSPAIDALAARLK